MLNKQLLKYYWESTESNWENAKTSKIPPTTMTIHLLSLPDTLRPVIRIDQNTYQSSPTSSMSEQSNNDQESASSSQVPCVRMVIQRYRFARILLEESRVVSVGEPSSSLLDNNNEATLGLLVYISFSALASQDTVEQAAKTILNMPVGTLGAWGDGSGVKNILQLLSSRTTEMKKDAGRTTETSPLSIILVPQANLIAKIKKNGKSIQYRDQIAKEKGRELYEFFCQRVEDLLLDHYVVCNGEKIGGSNKKPNDNNNSTPDASIPPDQLFRRRTDEFATFDDATHLPLTTIDGEPVTKSARKRMQKQYEAHLKRHEKWLKSNPQGNQPEAGDEPKTVETPQDHATKSPPPSLDPSFLQLVKGTFGARQGLEIQSDMGPFCHVVEI